MSVKYLSRRFFPDLVVFPTFRRFCCFRATSRASERGCRAQAGWMEDKYFAVLPHVRRAVVTAADGTKSAFRAAHRRGGDNRSAPSR